MWFLITKPMLLLVGAALAALSAVALAIIFYLGTPTIGLDSLPFLYLIAINILFIFTSFYVFGLYKRLNARSKKLVERHRQKLDSILGHIHTIFAARTGLTTYFLDYYTKSLTGSEYLKSVHDYLRVTVEETRVMFDELTGDNCAVAIKLGAVPDN